ncbi:hypothetical protein [Bartonella sp. AS69XJJH]|uniref:hypothetical protein n=1 Tax=Bartonella sp. AS69XJJH TaxID=3243508 RepID=UPI0035D076A9
MENIVYTIGNEGSSLKRWAIDFLACGVFGTCGGGMWGVWHMGGVWHIGAVGWLIESFIEGGALSLFGFCFWS